MTIFKKVVSVFFYLLAVLFFVVGLFLQFSPNFMMNQTGVLFFLFCVFGCISIATWVFSTCVASAEKKRCLIKSALFFVFVYYALTILNLLLFSSYFGRGTTAEVSYSFYFHCFTNFIPFLSIKDLWDGWRNNQLSLGYVLFNYIGNFVAFMPMGFFLPILFPKLKKFGWFFCTISSMVILLEIAQLVFRVGSCDIDDFILNVAGTCLVFFLLKRKPCQKLLHSLYTLYIK